MSRLDVVVRELFQFSELSEQAKEKARDWYREAQAGDNYFAEHITEEFAHALKLFGFVTGAKRNQPGIYWSGFSCQGDGACFEGSWSASNVSVDGIGAYLADRPAEYMRDGVTHVCKSNTEGNRIAQEFLFIAAFRPESSGCTTTNRNYMRVEWDSGVDRSDETHTAAEWTDIEAADSLANEEVSERFKQACTDAADWFYRSLETEYDYQNADEQVDDAITSNEYEFDADGSRA